MGILYSRCIGALKSKGNYIFALDNDDLFLDQKIIEKIYKIAKKDNFDIVEFKSFEIQNYDPNIKDINKDPWNRHQNNLILHQPKLGIFPISLNNNYFPNDFHIWGKCILAKLYQKAVNSLGIKRYSFFNCWTEDISILIIIFNIAKSFIYLDIYGIFHLISRNTTTFNLPKGHTIFSDIYLLDILIDFLKDNEQSKIYVVYKALQFEPKILIENKKASKYFRKILKKILNNKYINKNNKLKLIIKYKFLIS